MKRRPALDRPVASKAVVGDPSGKLKAAGAPAELRRWVAERPIDEAWDQTPRGDWLLWLAAIEGLPLVCLVDAAMAVVDHLVRDGVPAADVPLVERALNAVRALKDAAECREAAKACEAEAGAPDRMDYRTAPPERRQWALFAAAQLARAADLLIAADARQQGERDIEGRARAALIGVGEQIISRGDFDVPRFNPDDELMVGTLYGAEGAVQAAVRALAERGAEGEALRDPQETVANLVFEVLDPLREALRGGRLTGAMVRRVQAAAFKADREEDAIPAQKPRLVIWSAGILVPLGGAHFYTGHSQTGLVFLGSFVAALLVPGQAGAILLCAVLDVMLATGDQLREGEGKEARPESERMARAAVAVAVAHVAWWLLRAGSG